MIFEKEAITIQEEAEKSPGDRDGAPRNALYAEKQVFVQAATPNKVGKYRLRRGTLCGRRSGKRPRLANPLATSQHYRDRRFDVSKTFTDSQLSVGFGFAFSNQAQALDVSITARGLHGEAYRGHIFGMKFLFYLLYSTLS